MDDFVNEQLKLCNCFEQASQIFKVNEVDEEVFRSLTLDDLRALLPNKLGIQKKILKAVENLSQTTNHVNNHHPLTNPATTEKYESEILDCLQSSNSPSGQHFKSDLSSFMSQHQSNGASSQNKNSYHDFLSQIDSLMGNCHIAEKSKSDDMVPPPPPPKKRRHVPKHVADQRQKLPIKVVKAAFIKMMQENQVVIVTGETGSGKSTQLTQYLYEAGFGTCGKIGCTQPRRIAAKSLSMRVAQEMGVELGEEVGYRIRFENKSASNTIITYMTDGILLQELSLRPNIYEYSVIILDEAHERSLNTDILFGLLKSSLKQRPDMKVVVTSATLNAEKFSKYFNNAPVFNIPGRTYHVDIIYKSCPEPDYMNSCVKTVIDITSYEEPGDILVFLSGGDEIERCCDLLYDRDPDLYILPCYSALPIEQQNLVFEPAPKGKRKVVVATNIAETSLTIDGVVYVVDSGVVKQNEYDPRKGLSTLAVTRISQAQAIQRAGRSGRTREGKTYRLYSEEVFYNMPKTPIPEIQRSNLDSTILLLCAHGVDVHKFDFIDPPNPDLISTSLTGLQDLNALDSDFQLTAIGRKMSNFPVDPRLSKVLIMAEELNCCDEILTIVSIISAMDTNGKVFLRPKKHQFLADLTKASFFKPQGDHLTLLNVHDTWRSNSCSKAWCKENFINGKVLEDIADIRMQIRSIMETNRIYRERPYGIVVNPLDIQEAIVSAYFSQVAHKTAKGHGYITYSNPNEREQCYIHPGSCLFKSKPGWVIYEEMVNTGKQTFLVNCIAIDPRMIKTHAPNFYPKLVQVFPQLMMFY